MPSRSRHIAAAVTVAATVSGLTAASAGADVLPWQLATNSGSLARSPKPSGDAPLLCIVDTGVDLVPSVANNVVGRYTLLEDPDIGDGSYVASNPGSGHGTYVAQTAVQQWPHIRILSVRIGDASGALAHLYLQAVKLCRTSGADVINLSIGAKAAPSATEQTRLAAEIKTSSDEADIDVVAGGGNNPGPTNWPAAALTDVGLAVGAFDNSARWCPWASGQSESIIRIGAPGCDMETPATHGAERMLLQGSSFSGPQVAATLAAVQAYAPGLTAPQRRDAMLGLPNGMLDANEVLRRVGRADLITPEPAPVTPSVAAPAPQPGPLKTNGTATPADELKDDPGYFTNANDPDPREARLTLRWSGKRLVVRSSYAPRGARLTVRISGRRALLRARGGRLIVPASLSRPKARLVVRLISGGGKLIATRSFKATRNR